MKALPLFFVVSCTILIGHDYDLIIIGAGTAGMQAAIIAHDMGKRVAIVEKNRLGGDRLSHGDIPYKILFSIASKMSNAAEAHKIGLVSISAYKTSDHKLFDYIAASREEVSDLMQQNLLYKKKIKLIAGSAQFVDAHTIAIDGQQFSSDKFLIATGARSYIPEIEGLSDAPYVTQETFFRAKKLPASIIIMGGSLLGLELASALNAFGVNVVVIMSQSLVLPTFDYELAELFTQQLLNKGIIIACNHIPIKIDAKNGSLRVFTQDKAGKECSFEAESLFCAMGLVPNVERLALENAGVRVYQNADNVIGGYSKNLAKNAIITNPFLQTTAPNIYACGDVIGLHNADRVAAYQASVAVHNMFNDSTMQQFTHYAKIPKYIFAVDTEFGSIGLTEQSALKKLNDDVLIYRYDYHTSERACIDGNRHGLAKFICNKNGMLLGVHVVGKHARSIIDSVHIGQQLDAICAQKQIHLSSIFNDKNILYEVSCQCAGDVKKNIEPQQGIVGTVLSLFG